MAEPLATVAGSVFVWKHMDDGERREGAPAEHISVRIQKNTPLSESIAALHAAGINNDSIAALATVTLEKARRFSKLKKARGDVLRKSEGWTVGDALEVIVDRLAARALVKAALAEKTGVGASLITEDERNAAALLLKAKHSTRHPLNGQFISTGSKPTYTPGPASDDYSGAPTYPVEPGTGNAAGDGNASPRTGLWFHSGAKLPIFQH